MWSRSNISLPICPSKNHVLIRATSTGDPWHKRYPLALTTTRVFSGHSGNCFGSTGLVKRKSSARPLIEVASFQLTLASPAPLCYITPSSISSSFCLGTHTRNSRTSAKLWLTTILWIMLFVWIMLCFMSFELCYFTMWSFILNILIVLFICCNLSLALLYRGRQDRNLISK